MDQIADLPLAEADRLARSQIEHHREQMAAWRRARAQRMKAERDAGRSVEEIASEVGVSVATVYEVLRAARAENA